VNKGCTITSAITQEARRSTTDSFGACTEFASVINHAPPIIKDGAVHDIFAAGHAGSLASSTLAGVLETTWN
jgi:hypothetical protein